MKLLINVSNHPVSNWSDEQKKGWDKIIDIPFPNVPPQADTNELVDLKEKIFNKVLEIKNEYNVELFVMLQGEFTLCYMLYGSICMNTYAILAIPTTERVVEEKDGKKISTFKFVKWRFL